MECSARLHVPSSPLCHVKHLEILVTSKVIIYYTNLLAHD
jgi:hypothetical protein